MAQVSGLRRDKERERERRAKAAKMRTLIAQARAIWILHGSCYLATPKKQGKHRKERKRGGGLRHLVGWQDGAETHHLEGRMSEGVGEEDELGQIDGAGRGGDMGKSPERARERKRPRPDILALHILISFGFHSHTPRCMTPSFSLPRNSLK